MQQVCAKSIAVGCMHECSMTVVIHTGSHSALTAPSMTTRTSLTCVLLLNFVSNSVLVVSFNGNRLVDLMFVGHPTV